MHKHIHLACQLVVFRADSKVCVHPIRDGITHWLGANLESALVFVCSCSQTGCHSHSCYGFGILCLWVVCIVRYRTSPTPQPPNPTPPPPHPPPPPPSTTHPPKLIINSNFAKFRPFHRFNFRMGLKFCTEHRSITVLCIKFLNDWATAK